LFERCTATTAGLALGHCTSPLATVCSSLSCRTRQGVTPFAVANVPPPRHVRPCIHAYWAIVSPRSSGLIEAFASLHARSTGDIRGVTALAASPNACPQLFARKRRATPRLLGCRSMSIACSQSHGFCLPERDQQVHHQRTIIFSSRSTGGTGASSTLPML
jgi:hypothetical protein